MPSLVWVGEVWSKHGLKWQQECAFTCWRPISPLWFLRNSAIGCKWGKLAPFIPFILIHDHAWMAIYTAISRKGVGKRARRNPERDCWWFWVHCYSKKFERMAREAMDVCLRALKESNKADPTAQYFRNSALTIFHITFRHCRVTFFPTTFLEIAVCIYVYMFNSICFRCTRVAITGLGLELYSYLLCCLVITTIT